MATDTQDERLAPEDEEAVAAANAQGDYEGAAEGRTIEELAEDGEGEDVEPARIPPTQLAIEGTRDRLTPGAGGKHPTESEIRIMGGRRPINGQLDKGEVVTVLSTGTIREVDFIDHDDDWGNVQKTTRVHKMRQLHVRVASPESLMRALADVGVQRAELAPLFDQVVGEQA